MSYTHRKANPLMSNRDATWVVVDADDKVVEGGFRMEKLARKRAASYVAIPGTKELVKEQMAKPPEFKKVAKPSTSSYTRKPRATTTKK